MNKVRRILSFSVLSVLAIALSGCAFGTRQPTLVYPSHTTSDATGIAHAAPAPKKIEIILVKFADQRADTNAVGTVRNGFGMKTADVIPTNDVADWVTDAIRSELTGLGYTVVSNPAAADADSAVTVSGAILNVYCDVYFNYTGQVSLIAMVTRGGKPLLDKHYSGEGSAGTNWAATAESYSESLALALEDALRKFIPELEQQLARASAR